MKARRAAAPAPLTTEGDSLPSQGEGRGGVGRGPLSAPSGGVDLREGEPVRGRAKPAPAQPLGD